MTDWAGVKGIPFEGWRLRNIDQQIAEFRRKQGMERKEEKPPARPVGAKGGSTVPRQGRVF